MNPNNIFLFEHSDEAIELVKSGNAVVGPGGIRRKGDTGTGFLELSKPVPLSIADFQDMFADRSDAAELGSRVEQLETSFQLYKADLATLNENTWLANALSQKTFVLTQNGFQQTINGLHHVSKQLNTLEKTLQRSEIMHDCRDAKAFANYLQTDIGLLRLGDKYDVINGNIANHLDDISAYLENILNKLANGDGDSYVNVQIINCLFSPFVNVVRLFSARYYYCNKAHFMPGDYEEWVRVIRLIRDNAKLSEKTDYYINLKESLPFRKKVLFSKKLSTKRAALIRGLEFDHDYITTHSLEEYRNRIPRECYTIDDNIILFLGDGENE